MRELEVCGIPLPCYDEPAVDAEAYVATLEECLDARLPSDYRYFFVGAEVCVQDVV